jgi:mono/diheme cytochrome c family protein
MKKTIKVLKWTGIVLFSIVILLFAFVQLTWDKKFEAPYPDIKASTDSSVIARGKYLAFGLSHCATCHVPMDKIMEVENGLEMPMSGGWELSLSGLGDFHAPNITPDEETGIGKLTDNEIARTLRHGVGNDGRLIFPFMPYQEMTDEDLTAIISFIRSQAPTKHQVNKTELGFMAKALITFGLFKPEGPKNTPLKSIERDSTIEYGKYLANNVANCRGCHTQMDLSTGEFIGKDFAGNSLFGPDAFSEGYAFVSPNITPDKATGIMANWSEEFFITRFKAGRVHKGTPMPWGAFSRIDETDLKAIYRYLNSLEPVNNMVTKTIYLPGEYLPE